MKRLKWLLPIDILRMVFHLLLMGQENDGHVATERLTLPVQFKLDS